MKKIFPMLAVVLVIGACLPSGFPGAATPTALIQATSTSSSVAPTEPIPSTGTPAPVEFTVTPVISSSTASLTTPPNLTATLATSTDLPPRSYCHLDCDIRTRRGILDSHARYLEIWNSSPGGAVQYHNLVEPLESTGLHFASGNHERGLLHHHRIPR